MNVENKDLILNLWGGEIISRFRIGNVFQKLILIGVRTSISSKADSMVQNKLCLMVSCA